MSIDNEVLRSLVMYNNAHESQHPPNTYASIKARVYKTRPQSALAKYTINLIRFPVIVVANN